MSPPRRIAIVGAGAAGLIAAKELVGAGFEPLTFETRAQPGGIWRAGAESPVYTHLRTNLPRELMALRSVAFETIHDDRRFPGHEEVIAYLDRIARSFDLLRTVRTSTTITRIRERSADLRDGPRAYEVETTEGTETFDAVAICNGHYHEPRIPDTPGLASFEGTWSHSIDYRDPLRYRGQRVVVVGARSSGIDISLELAATGARVFVCAREHDAHLTENPATTRGDASERGSLTLHAPMAQVRDRTVILEDGTSVADVHHVLYCTGYRYALPFLSSAEDEEAAIVPWDDDFVGPLYLDLLCPSHPRVAFIGLPFAVVPFPLMELQARYFARTLSGVVHLPSARERANEATERIARLVQLGTPRRHWLRYGERQFDYMNDLARRLGEPGLPSWFAPLYRAISRAKREDPAGYRDRLDVAPNPGD